MLPGGHRYYRKADVEGLLNQLPHMSLSDLIAPWENGEELRGNIITPLTSHSTPPTPGIIKEYVIASATAYFLAVGGRESIGEC